MPRLKMNTFELIRDKVESTALMLFVRHGYAATTTREIASASGYTAGALYAHYPSKEALFAAVVARYRKRISDDPGLRDALRNSDFPYDIKELARAISRLVRENRAYWKLWYIDVLEFGGKHFKSQLAPKAVITDPLLRARLDRLRDRRELTMDPDLAFVMVYMHLFNYFLVETIFGGRAHYGVPENQAVEAISAVFMRGLLARSAS
jgi:AcrR family transcriptional regulator